MTRSSNELKADAVASPSLFNFYNASYRRNFTSLAPSHAPLEFGSYVGERALADFDFASQVLFEIRVRERRERD